MTRRSTAGRSRLWAAAALPLLALAGVQLWRSAGSETAEREPAHLPAVDAGEGVLEPSPAPSAPNTARTPKPDVRWHMPSGELRAQLPEMLRDSPVSGEFSVDAEGHFVPTREARLVFDHFFLASHRASVDEIHAWIELEIERRLDPPASDEVRAVAERYVELRRLMRSIADWDEDLERRLERLIDLRRSALGPELAEIFFGAEERRARIDLQVYALRRDERLSEAEREARIQEVEAQLPAEILAARRATDAPVRVREEVERLRAEGASEAEVFAVREQEFGREAAQRLADLDAQRARTREAWSAYRPQREALLADSRLSPEEREARLEALRRSYFAEDEIREVERRDRIEAMSGITLP